MGKEKNETSSRRPPRVWDVYQRRVGMLIIVVRERNRERKRERERDERQERTNENENPKEKQKKTFSNFVRFPPFSSL